MNRGRPRIVVVAQAAPAQGGIASFAHLLVDDPELNERFDMTLLNTTRKAVRRAGTFTVANLWHAIVDTVRTFTAARRADVVHVQTALVPMLPLLRALALVAAARIGGAKVLCHVHSGRVNSGRAEAFTPGRVTRTFIGGLRAADRVLTCADAGTSTLLTVVPGLDVETVDNAVDLSLFAEADPGESAGDVRLVYLGTLSRRKGLGDLADALRLLRERRPSGWTIEVVGGAAEVGEAEAGELRAAMTAAGFGDSFVGAKPADEVRRLLAAAHVFVQPSHWEGQSIALLEAMATGLAVIATPVGAVPDVVRDGVDGLLVDPHDVRGLADGLDQLIGDAALRASLGASARRRIADGHDLTHLRDRMTQVYESVIV